MAKRYEYYNTGDNGFDSAYQDRWLCQTFTPQVTHRIMKVKLLLYKILVPTTTTVRIRATDADGAPTGLDLISASFDGNTLTSDTAGEWKEIALPPYKVGTKYALISSELANVNVAIGWRRDAGNGSGYARGAMGLSVDGGVTWTMGEDGVGGFMFEEWGNPALLGNPNVDQLIYQHAERMKR